MTFSGLPTSSAMNYASAHERKQEDKALRNVAIEGSAVLKIVKHCQESQPLLVTGQLLGLDMGTRLEITDCFPFPVSVGPTASYVHICTKSLRQNPPIPQSFCAQSSKLRL